MAFINNLRRGESSNNKRTSNMNDGHDAVARCTLMHMTHPGEDFNKMKNMWQKRGYEIGKQNNSTEAQHWTTK